MIEIKFAENLKTLREARGLTQSALAEKLGVNQRTISAWEKGVCEPSYLTLALICEFFEETFDGILL